MSKKLRITSAIAGIVIVAAALLWTSGVFRYATSGITQTSRNESGNDAYQTGQSMPYGNDTAGNTPSGYRADSDTTVDNNDDMGRDTMDGDSSPDANMMDSSSDVGTNMMGKNYGMLDGSVNPDSIKPLTVTEARTAVKAYLSSLDNKNLAIKEIMIFDNNAYAIIAEKNTGIGAFELLVNPASKVVFPEYGPNMMWNLKYSVMGPSGTNEATGASMMMERPDLEADGMMQNYGFYDSSDARKVSADMPVTAGQAKQVAQAYLDQYSPGVSVTDDITQFYGYYTIDLERNGRTVGMLSVNGYTRQVFPHAWHGKFIEMTEEPGFS